MSKLASFGELMNAIYADVDLRKAPTPRDYEAEIKQLESEVWMNPTGESRVRLMRALNVARALLRERDK